MGIADFMENSVEQEAVYRRWANAATWRGLLSSESHNGFSEAWLALLCAQIDLTIAPLAGAGTVVRQGFVALGDQAQNRYQRVAMQGPEMDVSVLLGKAAERAMHLRHGTVQPGEGGGTCQLAYPIMVGDTLHGVVAIDLTHRARDHLDAIMRLAQWGTVWFSRLLQQSAPAAGGGDPDDLALQLEVFDQALGQGTASAAAEALATTLAERLGLDKLSFGLRRGQAVSIFAASHGGFTPIINDYLAALQAAIAEVADSGAAIIYPAPDGAIASPHAAHARLCRAHGCDWVRSIPVPLPSSADAQTGHDLLLLVAEGTGSAAPRLEETLITVGRQIAMVLALRLYAEEPLERRAERVARAAWARLVVPRTRNIAIGAAVAALLLFFIIPFPYHIHAEATLEPGIKRALVAPFDGYVAEATARPGDYIAAGAPLGRLDDRDLRHQKRELDERLAETNREINEAMGHFDNAKVGVLTAHRAQIEADGALIAESLSRTVLTAPYDALVVSGDKTQSTGAPVRRGDTLYEVSPLNAFRLELNVPQADFADVAVGQTGRVLLSSVAHRSFPFHVVRITPIATIHDGKTVLRVDADLDGTDGVLRPGMQGVGEIRVGHAHLFWLLTHRIVDWLRVNLWAWMP
jgi:hypothetical protein